MKLIVHIRHVREEWIILVNLDKKKKNYVILHLEHVEEVVVFCCAETILLATREAKTLQKRTWKDQAMDHRSRRCVW